VNKKSVALFLAVLTIAGLGVSYNEVVLKPFPFLHVSYISSSDWDAAPNGFYSISIDGVSSEHFDVAIENLSNLPNLEQKIELATLTTREIMRGSNGWTIRESPRVVLNDDALYKSICSEASKIFATLMQLANVPSRVVWMHGHTVSEVWNGDKWVLIDTYGNIRAKSISGEQLGIREVIQGYSSATFRKVVEDANSLPMQYLDVGYLTSEDNAYKNQNLLLVVSGEDLFKFHKRTRNLDDVVSSVIDFSSSAVGEGKQLVIDDYYVGNFGVKLLERPSFQP
jgi:hypothetical protein